MRDAVDLAWAAGLFEGEGCFTVSHRKKAGRVYGQLVATMTMADEDIVRRFHKIVGFGNFYDLGVPKMGNKPVWRWSVQSRADVRRFYELVEPWLGIRRLAQGEAVLQTPRGDLTCRT